MCQPTNKPVDLIDEVYSFCEAVGLPTRLSDIGLADVTDDELKRVAEKTCDKAENIYNEPFEITPAAVYDAIKSADSEGRRRRP